MRCDYPTGYNEDHLEHVCETFFEEFDEDNESATEIDYESLEIDDENDANFSSSSLHTISDDSLSTEELSGDEGEDMVSSTSSQESLNPDEEDIIVSTVSQEFFNPDESTISQESLNPKDFHEENPAIDLSVEKSCSPEGECHQFVNDSSDVPSENHQPSDHH